MEDIVKYKKVYASEEFTEEFISAEKEMFTSSQS